MPIRDIEKRRRDNAERNREKRAAGVYRVDPDKEAARKARWYEEGGKEKIVEANRQRRERGRVQELQSFACRLLRKLKAENKKRA